MRFPAFFRPRALALAALAAGTCAGTLAGGLERAQQRGTLVAGIRHIVPEYQGGMKFRTPETLDNALLEALAGRRRLALATVPSAPGTQAQLLDAGKVDLALDAIAEDDPLRRTHTVIPIGYATAPMAIMRTDTDIKTWEQLKGRKVCVSEDGRYASSIAEKHGAIEKRYKAPADALIALRIGECDAAVHDSAMLEELIAYPEWKKFSARLPAGPRVPLAFVLPASDRKSAAFLQQVAKEWTASGRLGKMTKTAVRHIAFEVYLDQDVPDCH